MPRKLNHSAGRRKGRDCRLGGWERVQFSGRLTWLLLVLLVLLVLLLLLLLLHLAGQRLPSCAACFMCARHYVYEKCRGVRGRE